MKKSISRIIGVIMLIVAIVFIMFALNHQLNIIILTRLSTEISKDVTNTMS